MSRDEKHSDDIDRHTLGVNEIDRREKLPTESGQKNAIEN
jgi:hypothetical protein